MQDLHITTIQANLAWEDKATNLKHFDGLLDPLKGTTDLVVLPEMFTTGFTMNAAALAETTNGRSLEWMAQQAAQLNAVVCGSLIIKENDQFFNRLIWMLPNGHFQHYDKRHLFTLAREQLTYTAGQQKLVVDYKDWKICPMICYDLRFPAWSRNQEDYDLLIYVANWPKPRAHHWRSLLTARAIENQSYVIGVNRVGIDEKGNSYSGDTAVIDYQGELLYQKAEVEDVYSTSLSYTNQETFRAKLRFLPDRDDFSFL